MLIWHMQIWRMHTWRMYICTVVRHRMPIGCPHKLSSDCPILWQSGCAHRVCTHHVNSIHEPLPQCAVWQACASTTSSSLTPKCCTSVHYDLSLTAWKCIKMIVQKNIWSTCLKSCLQSQYFVRAICILIKVSPFYWPQKSLFLPD